MFAELHTVGIKDDRIFSNPMFVNLQFFKLNTWRFLENPSSKTSRLAQSLRFKYSNFGKSVPIKAFKFTLPSRLTLVNTSLLRFMLT